MKSHITKSFRKCFADLPQGTRIQTRKSYEFWRKDNYHKSLQFKQVSKKPSMYSVRIGIGYRALGLVENVEIYWFWIGSHADYDTLLKRL